MSISTRIEISNAPHTKNKNIFQTGGVAGHSSRNADFLFGTDPILFRGYLAMRELCPIILRFCDDLLRVRRWRSSCKCMHPTGSNGATPHTSAASTDVKHRPPKPNSFRLLPSNVLYVLNHSRMSFTTSGACSCRSTVPWARASGCSGRATITWRRVMMTNKYLSR